MRKNTENHSLKFSARTRHGGPQLANKISNIVRKVLANQSNSKHAIEWSKSRMTWVLRWDDLKSDHASRLFVLNLGIDLFQPCGHNPTSLYTLWVMGRLLGLRTTASWWKSHSIGRLLPGATVRSRCKATSCSVCFSCLLCELSWICGRQSRSPRSFFSSRIKSRQSVLT